MQSSKSPNAQWRFPSGGQLPSRNRTRLKQCGRRPTCIVPRSPLHLTLCARAARRTEDTQECRSRRWHTRPTTGRARGAAADIRQGHASARIPVPVLVPVHFRVWLCGGPVRHIQILVAVFSGDILIWRVFPDTVSTPSLHIRRTSTGIVERE